MFALISRILNLSGRYKSRIQAAFLCAFVESILSKMPIFMAFIVLAGFADNTLTGKTCLFVGLLIKRECRYGDYTLSRKDDQRWQKRKHRSRSMGPLH